MSLKTKVVEKLERIEVEVAGLPRPVEAQTVVAVTEKIAALEEQIEAFAKTKAAQEAATRQAQEQLARTIAARDPAGRKAALEALDDSTLGLARVAARVPVLEKARLEFFEERAVAAAVAIQNAGAEWDAARTVLDRCREQLLAAERAVRESIMKFEEARLHAFTVPALARGLIPVKFLRNTYCQTSVYAPGEVASFGVQEAGRLVSDGSATYVNEARAAAARELAARA